VSNLSEYAPALTCVTSLLTDVAALSDANVPHIEAFPSAKSFARKPVLAANIAAKVSQRKPLGRLETLGSNALARGVPPPLPTARGREL
jgi:hypothetical protein